MHTTNSYSHFNLAPAGKIDEIDQNADTITAQRRGCRK
ncbi:hypothetical protein CEV34_0004 [Brucella pseudogrignonensis]|uniref:Uncharacterized protein n=1 Tax=Brucella pseudogrignonensis TaxID=419475 RepID=A0A256GVE3_9HYPH|nr:hypothetical protein CEV34_0004 [Brucella pseudogrignonensis]